MANGDAFDPTLAPGKPGVSDDVSQPSGLRRAWDAWTSRPENNAALLQFGLNMMSPYPGNFAGHLAESIGRGAEAHTENVGAQQEEESRAAKEELAQREEARKEEETGYYGQSVRSLERQRAQTAAGGGVTPLKMWQARLRARADFDKQLGAADVGAGDTMWEEIRQRYPGKFKTKLDYKNSPEYQADVEKYVRAHSAEQLAGMDLGGGSGAAPPGGEGGFAPPPGAVIRYQGNKPIYFNPETKQPYPGQE